jgi:hypothetical protein
MPGVASPLVPTHMISRRLARQRRAGERDPRQRKAAEIGSPCLRPAGNSGSGQRLPSRHHGRTAMPRRRQPIRRGGGTLATVVSGALAGAVGVWALDRIDWFMWNRETDETRARTVAARPGGEPPPRRWSPSSRMRRADADGGRARTGIAGGSLLDRDCTGDRLRAVSRPAAGNGIARGAGLGMTLFLSQDEVLNTVTGARRQTGRLSVDGACPRGRGPPRLRGHDGADPQFDRVAGPASWRAPGRILAIAGIRRRFQQPRQMGSVRREHPG